MEKELLEINNRLMDPEVFQNDGKELLKKYEETKKNLNEEMNKWTIYSHELEEFIKTGTDGNK